MFIGHLGALFVCLLSFFFYLGIHIFLIQFGTLFIEEVTLFPSCVTCTFSSLSFILLYGFVFHFYFEIISGL